MQRQLVNKSLREALSKADKELLKRVQKDEIEYIRFETCDLYCRSIGKLVPVKQLENCLLNG